MKTLYLIRHAKSSWKDPMLSDEQRPLNSRGKRDAPFMAQLLRGRVPQADLLVSSPSIRTQKTAAHFAKAFDISKKDIVLKEEIYEASLDDLMRVAQALPNIADTVLLFGHNPTLTILANRFTSATVDNVPTCGIVRIDADIEQWSNFSFDTGRLTEFHYPKQYFT